MLLVRRLQPSLSDSVSKLCLVLRLMSFLAQLTSRILSTTVYREGVLTTEALHGRAAALSDNGSSSYKFQMQSLFNSMHGWLSTS